MSARSKFGKSLAAAAMLGAFLGTALAGTNSFDSLNEFSGTQGSGNWQYGYYLTPGDANSFVEMSYFSVALSNAWSEGTSNPPWTLLWAQGGHPNGIDGGSQHDAVRRWTSGADGTVRVVGNYSMANTGATRVGLILDGSTVWSSLAISSQQIFNVSKPVTVGAHLDFFISTDGYDYNDSTNFAVTGQVTGVPEPETFALMLVGLIALNGVRKRRGTQMLRTI